MRVMPMIQVARQRVSAYGENWHSKIAARSGALAGAVCNTMYAKIGWALLQ
jgi:hypothetical protein